MVGLLLIGFVMVLISVAFGITEFMYWVNAVKAIPTDGAKATLVYPVRLLQTLPKLIPFALDFGLAIFMSAFMGFGGGVVGGITGLFASNCVSAYIYWRGHIRIPPKPIA